MIKKVILAISLLLAAAAPAAAQFADQATYAGTGGGTANAQTLTLANASSYADLVGVAVKYVPAATNTGAATLTVNGFGSSPAFRKPNGAGVTALTGGEIVSGQPTMIMYDGTFFNLLAPAGLPVGASQLQSSSLAYGVPTNLAISASVAANALTIAVKGADGNDPSATNPVLVSFRSATIAAGSPSVVSIVAPLSFTIASTSTMGCVSGQMCRLWLVLLNNAGTPVIGAFNALSGTSVAPINEAALQTCASGTSGGSSAQTYYCSTSAVTAKAIKIIGYIDISEVTAGTWAAGPTYTQLFGPGIKKPGDVVQTVYVSTGSNLAGTNVYSISNTAPVPASGLSTGLAPSISATSAANVLQVTGNAYVSQSGAGTGQAGAFLYNTTTSTTVATALGSSNPTNTGCTVSIGYRVVAGVTSAVTYTLYGFSNNTNTFINQQAVGTPILGGTSATFLRIEEIMGSLPRPANDDGSDALRKVA